MGEDKITSIIPQFSKDDFLTGSAPYDWLYERSENRFILKQYVEQMTVLAKGAGVTNFRALWRDYLAERAKKSGVRLDNVTEFSGQPMELACGDYVCNDLGIVIYDQRGAMITVCDHPIMPVRRLVNVDSGETKVEIAYKRNGQWRQQIVDKVITASATKIVELARFDIGVNSENARDMVRYLSVLEGMNYDTIPGVKSVSRLGWIPEHGFSPYMEGLIFDGELCYKTAFEAVKPHGDFDKWRECAEAARDGGKIARIMLAASCASVLVEPCNALPFFVHLWGGTEAGKTVALMLAASVWASPAMGKYIHTFNSTSVAQEMMAGFCNSLPLCIDELMVIKDRKDFDQMIYMLTEGVGKNRGARYGGIQRMQTWRNCILTTSETPISTASSGGGAVNRVIEIDCKTERIFADPHAVVETVAQNYGMAGPCLIEALKNDAMRAHFVGYQQEAFARLIKHDTTEKQAQAASVILAADYLAAVVLFGGGVCLTDEDMLPFLTTRKEVSVNDRAYEWLQDWIASNATRFGDCDFGERYGMVEGRRAYIIKSVFDKVMAENGFSPAAFLSWASDTGKIDRAEKTTKLKRLRGYENPVRCVWLKLPDNREDMESDHQIPFDDETL